MFTADVGLCHRCDADIPSSCFKFCGGCSVDLELCYVCGSLIEALEPAEVARKIAVLDAQIQEIKDSINIPKLADELIVECQQEKAQWQGCSVKNRIEVLYEALD